MLAETLKALKNQKGWSSQRLADAANLPVDTLNKILSGSTKNPNPETLRRLADALGVSPEELRSVSAPQSEPAQQKPEDLSALYERQHAQTVSAYEQQINTLIENYEKRLKEAHDRDRLQHQRHERQFFTMLAVIVALIAVIIYLIIDALHGNWGIFQYADILSRVNPSNAVASVEKFFI